MTNINLSCRSIAAARAQRTIADQNEMENAGPETSRFPNDTRNEADGADGRSNKARARHVRSRPALRNLVALSSPFRSHGRRGVGARRGHGCSGEIPLRNLAIVASIAFRTGSAAEPAAGYAFGWRTKALLNANRLKSLPANRPQITSSTGGLRGALMVPANAISRPRISDLCSQFTPKVETVDG
ncbi:hypothetical protein [Bradyrhizobium zhanjiangense]|uniref:hypothetical protein n=1 Tax=Bradyrhizobium zhanjiangense TaxID=1325107 RepID=UPI0013E8D7A5|nr:hypothetical protein [Bradyrhizobium zhanjiangense]